MGIEFTKHWKRPTIFGAKFLEIFCRHNFSNNAEYRDYNSCKPTYGGANHRKYDNHHHYNYSDGHYESHDMPENTKDAADFLGQMVELKSQFTEMKSQQQILLESRAVTINRFGSNRIDSSSQPINRFKTTESIH